MPSPERGLPSAGKSPALMSKSETEKLTKEINKMKQLNSAYANLFERYGSPSDEAEIRFYGYLTRPDKLDTFERIRHMDDSAAQMISNCKHLVAQLITYRQDLAKRYNELATMPSRDRLLLERVPNYIGKVVYYIRFFTDYEDGTTVCTASEAFEGRDRHKAIARFEELKKQRPGIEAEKRIEKQRWEK